METLTPAGPRCACGNLLTIADRGTRCRQCLLERPAEAREIESLRAELARFRAAAELALEALDLIPGVDPCLSTSAAAPWTVEQVQQRVRAKRALRRALLEGS